MSLVPYNKGEIHNENNSKAHGELPLNIGKKVVTRASGSASLIPRCFLDSTFSPLFHPQRFLLRPMNYFGDGVGEWWWKWCPLSSQEIPRPRKSFLSFISLSVRVHVTCTNSLDDLCGCFAGKKSVAIVFCYSGLLNARMHASLTNHPNFIVKKLTFAPNDIPMS